MVDHTLHILWLQSVQDVEEVFAIRKTHIRGGIRQVLHDLFVMLEHRVELLDRELIVQRYVDSLDLVVREQLLLFCKDLLEEVLVDVFLRRYVEL